jgi:hypothetical protein
MRALFVLLLCNMAFADSLGTNVYYSNDTDGNTVEKYSFTAWKDVKSKRDIGVGFTRLKYSNNDYSETGQGVRALFDSRHSNIWVLGHAGVSEVSDKKYFDGDVSALYFVKPGVIASGGVFGDIVDSPGGIQNGVTVKGLYFGVEAYNKVGGLTATARQSFYSVNNDTRTGYNLKAYVNVLIEGVSAYLDHSSFEHSDPNNPLYWSPEKFTRNNVGLNYRVLVNDYGIGVRGDVGQINTIGDRQSVSSFNVFIETPRYNSWYGMIRAGQDLNAFNYRFRFITIDLRFDI